jgi:hypothetical protein
MKQEEGGRRQAERREPASCFRILIPERLQTGACPAKRKGRRITTPAAFLLCVKLIANQGGGSSSAFLPELCRTI